MNRVKVLHIITRFITGGADWNTLFTVNGLNRQKFQPGLLVGRDADTSMLSMIAPDAEVLRLPTMIRGKHPLNLAACIQLYWLLKQERYDIVHTHTAMAGLIGRLAARFAGTRVVVHTLHGVTFHEFVHPLESTFWVQAERLLAGSTHRLITVGEDVKRKYLACGIGAPDQYVVIRSGMELDAFHDARRMSKQKCAQIKRNLGIDPAHIVVGTVTRLEPRKGPEYFLDAAADIAGRMPEITFLIVGDGYLSTKLQTRVRELNLDGRVIFTGFREDVASLLGIMDIFVLTSLWEGLPRVLVEAATVGKPIVCFDVEGAWEVVKEDVNGFIVPCADVSRLTDRIMVMLSDLDHWSAHGLQGIEIVGNRWNKATMIRQIEELYLELLRA